MQISLLFPGQGSQFVGMGADLFEARPDLLVDVADKVLGWSLRDICLNGPGEALLATDKAQPALYALSYVLWEAVSVRISPATAAGHSLGEYTALAAAGVFSFEDGLRLVMERGRAMEQAATLEASGMSALIGADQAQAEAVASHRRQEGGRVWVANLNAPGQIVVAGATDDMRWVGEHVKEFGIRRAIPLSVAGAFHTPMMATAQEALGGALRTVKMQPASFDVWANVSAAPVIDVVVSLEAQMTSPVRFVETLQGIAKNESTVFLHIGPGDATAGMAKRAVPGAPVFTLNSLDQIDEVVANIELLGTMVPSEETS